MSLMDGSGRFLNSKARRIQCVMRSAVVPVSPGSSHSIYHSSAIVTYFGLFCNIPCYCPVEEPAAEESPESSDDCGAGEGTPSVDAAETVEVAGEESLDAAGADSVVSADVDAEEDAEPADVPLANVVEARADVVAVFEVATEVEVVEIVTVDVARTPSLPPVS